MSEIDVSNDDVASALRPRAEGDAYRAGEQRAPR